MTGKGRVTGEPGVPGQQADPKWLEWARRLQAIGQTGLAYSSDPYDDERYKAVCDLAQEILAAGSETEIRVIRELFARDEGYFTPKIDLRAAVFRDGGVQGDAILMVRETSDGLWTLPGGWGDIGESPAEGIAKEVHEESGFEVRVVKLLGVYDKHRQGNALTSPHYTYKLFFLCELTGGEAKTSIETSEVDFFTEDSLPPLSLGRVTEAQVRRVFEHKRNPDWPADFD